MATLISQIELPFFDIDIKSYVKNKVRILTLKTFTILMLMSGFECVCAWCSWRGLEARTWEMFGCICDMCTHD
jgi:hypothetical protein